MKYLAGVNRAMANYTSRETGQILGGGCVVNIEKGEHKNKEEVLGNFSPQGTLTGELLFKDKAEHQHF